MCVVEAGLSVFNRERSGSDEGGKETATTKQMRRKKKNVEARRKRVARSAAGGGSGCGGGWIAKRRKNVCLCVCVCVWWQQPQGCVVCGRAYVCGGAGCREKDTDGESQRGARYLASGRDMLVFTSTDQVQITDSQEKASRAGKYWVGTLRSPRGGS